MYSNNCKIYPITESLNALSNEGQKLAIEGCRAKNNLLWSSIPCTAGSGLANYSRKDRKAWYKILKKKRKAKKLFGVLEKLAIINAKHQGTLAIEWPTSCSYWSWPCVQDLVRVHGLVKINIHGCALGLVDKEGKPIKKPWTIATNHPGLIKVFSSHRYRCKHHPNQHGKCEGKTATGSAGYTRTMVRQIHKAHNRWTSNKDHVSAYRRSSYMNPYLGDLVRKSEGRRDRRWERAMGKLFADPKVREIFNESEMGPGADPPTPQHIMDGI